MAIEPDLAAAIRRLLPQATVRLIQPVRTAAPRRAAVFKVELDGGSRVAVKDYGGSGWPSQGRELVRTEVAALRRLGALGCPVPRILAFDPKKGVLVTEWAGDRPLEAAISAGTCDPAGSAMVVRAFMTVELGLDTVRDRLSSKRVAAAGRALRDETGLSIRRLQTAVVRLAPPANDVMERVRRALGAIAEHTLSGLWTLGAKDFNASNVIVGPDGPVFIDFSVIGADWPERRLAGYLTATGARSPVGNFATLLDEDTALVYGRLADSAWNRQDGAKLLDSHFLLAMLTAAARIFAALEAPDRPTSRALLQSWPNAEERLIRLRELVRKRLCANPAADELRAVLG